MGGSSSSPPPPTITATRLHYRVHEYSSVSLKCDVCNASSCVWTFRKEGSAFNITDSRYSISPHELTIPEVTEEDEGTYECKVTDGHGNWASSQSMTLEVYSNMENFQWGDVSETNALRQRIRDAELTTESAGIIVYGSVGSGKSGFINSVKTALTGRLSTPASQGLTSDTRTTKISYINIQELPVIICDIPGFHRTHDCSREFLIQDIILNRVPDGTEFSDWKRKHDTGSHCVGSGMERSKWIVVYVHSCTDTDKLPDEVYQRIRDQELRIRRLGAQLAIVITNIDQLEVRELSRIYRGEELRQVMEELREKTEVDVINMYPVKNYTGERRNVVNMDILLLNAMSRLIDRLNDIN
ncbi:interferon-induced protein 44-like [Argopecten irradians]|uniref:interferon-induced protein 44-like n=1 Tax=Argopecten irradians TaxID=31199 RepID=UPI0037219479